MARAWSLQRIGVLSCVEGAKRTGQLVVQRTSNGSHHVGQGCELHCLGRHATKSNTASRKISLAQLSRDQGNRAGFLPATHTIHQVQRSTSALDKMVSEARRAHLPDLCLALGSPHKKLLGLSVQPFLPRLQLCLSLRMLRRVSCLVNA